MSAGQGELRKDVTAELRSEEEEEGHDQARREETEFQTEG